MGVGPGWVPFWAVSITAERPATLASGVRSALFGDEETPHPALIAAGVVAVVGGVALRFWAPTALWLDEALSVNIARLPLSQIPRR